MGKKILGVIATLLLVSAARAQDISAPRVLMHRSELPRGFAPAREITPTLTVPAETEDDVDLLSGIHTRIASVDDPIIARVVQPVLVNGQVALPSGTLLDGRITAVRSARRLHRPGELAFRFEQITLPDGESEPVTAVLAGLDNFAPPNTRVDAEGHLRGTRAFSWKGLAGGFGAWSAFAGVKYAVASTAALSSFLPATGAGVLGFELLWPRGNDVHVPPQTRCRIRLSYPVTVRVPW